MQRTPQDSRPGDAGKGSFPSVLAVSDPSQVDRWLEARRESVAPGVAQRARLVARLAAGGMVSGQALATELGVSRAAVHKHADILRRLGLGIRSVPGSGYSVSDFTDVVAAEALLPFLAGSSTGLGVPVHYEPRAESTNAIARESARAGARHGTLVITDYQHAGKGRLGRAWVSGPGRDLTFSLLLRPGVPPESAARFTLAASVAVADALAALGDLGHRVTIKWPNDVLIDGRKVCGILSEASMDMDRLHWLVVGIGLNVNGAPDQDVPAMERSIGALAPVSLRGSLGREVPRAPLLVGLLERLEERWAQAAGADWGRVIGRFHELDALSGRPVEVRSGSRLDAPPLIGIARGLSPEGELLVADADGATRAVFSGDVTLRRPPDSSP